MKASAVLSKQSAEKSIRLVVDSVTLINAVFGRDEYARRLIEEFHRSGRVVIVASIRLVDEYTRVLDRLMKDSKFDSEATLRGWRVVSRFLLYTIPITISGRHQQGIVPEDYGDDKVAECAIYGDAPHIVTSDPHLWSISGKTKTHHTKETIQAKSTFQMLNLL